MKTLILLGIVKREFNLRSRVFINNHIRLINVVKIHYMPSYIVQFSDNILCAVMSAYCLHDIYDKTTSGWAENVYLSLNLVGCFSFWIKQCITSLLGSLSITINVFWSTAGIVITEAHTVLGLQQINYTNLINSIFGP